MANCFKRDLAAEIILKDRLSDDVACTIGSDRWQLGYSDGDEDIVGVSIEQAPLQQVLRNRVFTLDGKSLLINMGENPLDLIIKRSLITTIKPDPFHPKTVAKIFELGIRDLDRIKAPLLAVIPIDHFQKPDFFHYFGHWVTEDERLICSVDSPQASCCLNGIRFRFRDQLFLVYGYCEDNKSARRQIIVESEGAFSYTEFCECVRRILVVIGFFSGTYYFGPFWIFHVSSHDFVAYNHCMSKGGMAKYHMWSLNPYEYLADADKEPVAAREIEKGLKPITRGQFEKLLVQLDEERFSHFFYIFQDICLNMSHLTASAKFPVYAACLEACREWWVHKDTDKTQQRTLLYSEEQRNEIIQEMEKILKTHYADSEDTEYLLDKKIRNLSIFRVGNMDELKDAIKGVGVVLSEGELKALRWRNDILHGRDIIKSTFSGDRPAAYINEVEHKLLVLHEIIWRFIMKSIGYDGSYVDVARVNELFRASKSNGGVPLNRQV